MNYEHKKSLAECTSKATEADFKLKAAKETAKAKLAKAEFKLETQKKALKMQQDRMEKLKVNLTKFEMKAPQSGTLAYPNEQYWGPDRQIREGATVYQNQTVFYLPNLRKMQVKVGIHESLVSKIKPDQPATIRIEAFPNLTFKGKVKNVAPLAQTTWFNASKNYSAIVTIDEIPEDTALKPGMTAQVEIVAGVYPNVLAIPVQAVATNNGKKYAYVAANNGTFQRREIQIGQSNESFVEVVSGIEADQRVALDSFQRGVVDFGDLQPLDPSLIEDEADAAAGSTLIEGDSKESETTSNEASEPSADSTLIGKTSSESETSLGPSGPAIPAGNVPALSPLDAPKKDASVPDASEPDASKPDSTEPDATESQATKSATGVTAIPSTSK